MIAQYKTGYEPKKCESCGVEFGCGANADRCWFSALKLNNYVIDDLRKWFGDCFCPN